MKKILVLIFVSFFLSSCATGRYDKAMITKIEDSTYRIAFRALNDKTSKLENYILVKGSELCLSNGYNYFSLNRQINKSVWSENIGNIMRSEAEIKLYKLQPNSIAGVYNCVEVMKNLGSTIDDKDLDNKNYRTVPIENDNKDLPANKS